MATKTIRIGSMEDIFQYDDADYDSAIETDHVIKAGEPSDPNDVLRLEDLGTKIWPVGSIYLSVDGTNPATVFGFGTWVRVAKGQFLVGQKGFDPDFGTVEGTGGSKVHTHDVDVGSTTSSGPSSTVTVDNNLDGSTVTVADDAHTHDVDPASVVSGDNSDLPPYFVIYVWKRTA